MTVGELSRVAYRHWLNYYFYFFHTTLTDQANDLYARHKLGGYVLLVFTFVDSLVLMSQE